MSLRQSYTLLSPLYDALVERATATMRKKSLHALDVQPGQQILISGIGTGLDIPFLPKNAQYTGIDLTPAMLARARLRNQQYELSLDLQLGDVMALDLPDQQFDLVIMHLILAVVPEPQRALTEAARVLRPGGRIIILDKFLKPGQSAPLRRLLSPLLARLATRTDVIFENLLAGCNNLRLVSDTPALARGWFRHIVLEKAP